MGSVFPGSWSEFGRRGACSCDQVLRIRELQAHRGQSDEPWRRRGNRARASRHLRWVSNVDGYESDLAREDTVTT